MSNVQRLSRRREAPPPTYLASELAAICDVDLKTIHNWCDRREGDAAVLEHFRTAGGHLRFEHGAVLRFLTRWGYPIPDQLLQDRPHVLWVAEHAEERVAAITALDLRRPGEVTATQPRAQEALGLWSTDAFYLHFFDDAAVALVALGERLGAGAAPDLVVLSLPFTGIQPRGWIAAARETLGSDTFRVLLVTGGSTPEEAREEGVVGVFDRHDLASVGQRLRDEPLNAALRNSQRGRRERVVGQEPIFVASEVARLWGRDLKTIHAWVDDGELEAFRTPGRHLRFRKRALLHFQRRYSHTIPPELGPARPRVMVLDPSAPDAAELAAVLAPRYEVMVRHNLVEGLAEIGVCSAGASSLDAVVVSFANHTVDPQRWLEALMRHPDTRYIRVIALGGNPFDRSRWNRLGLLASAPREDARWVLPALEAGLGGARAAAPAGDTSP
ncbi:MAG: helix-turn-helix domain-containing protein [Myxococcales bacterium]|nr:helix-turn-helix domain-containing protein [Myxococcales bacterium]